MQVHEMASRACHKCRANGPRAAGVYSHKIILFRWQWKERNRQLSAHAGERIT